MYKIFRKSGQKLIKKRRKIGLKLICSLALIMLAGTLTSNAAQASPKLYLIQSITDNTCLDVAGASTADGAHLITWGCTFGNNQKFYVTDEGGLTVSIHPNHSGKCVDVPGGSHANLVALQQWTCNHGANQRWFVSQTAVVSGAAWDYFTSANTTNMYMTGSTFGANVTQRISLQDYYGGRQVWALIPTT